MKTIFTKIGKFRYKCLLMGMWNYGDIFQAKLENILSDIEVVKVCIGDKLILIKDIVVYPATGQCGVKKSWGDGVPTSGRDRSVSRLRR